MTAFVDDFGVLRIIYPRDFEVRLSPWTNNGENVVKTLTPSFLIGSSSFLQIIKIIIRVLMSSKFGQIGLGAAELAALESLKNRCMALSTL